MNHNYEERYIATNGITLHAIVAGPPDGPLVVLLHGFPEFWYGWRKQIDPLAEAGYRVLVPDQRGYNLSDKPRGVAAYNIDELAADVIGLIDAEGRDKAVVVGHDWGAAVAWWTAIRYPDRVEKLVILNVPHPLVMQRHLRKSFSQLRKSWYMFFFQIPKLPESLMRLRNFRGMLDSLRKSSRGGVFDEADGQRYVQAWSQPGALTSMINWYRGLTRARPERVSSPRVKVPTLMIWGVGDRFLDVEMTQPSIELCDDGRLELIDEATHWVQHEEAPRVNALILDFLAGSSEQAPSETPPTSTG